MEKFALSANEVLQVLIAKNIPFLYHANTLATSRTFIQNDALLSRHYVESNNLFQSPQNSDADDKRYDVWDHVFLDGFDLHEQYKRPNHYGPVLFRFDLALLQNVNHVYITKSNPWYWKGVKEMDRFYSSIDDFSSQYLTGKKIDAQMMITLRNPGSAIGLGQYLHSIIVDNPSTIVNSASLGLLPAGTYLKNIIESDLAQNNLSHIPVLFRQHTNNRCSCWFVYNWMIVGKNKEFIRRFGR